MPSPVSFNLSLSPLPANFAGTPAELAQAIVDRLTITPAEPWSSFQNGGTIPSSNVGPILYQEREWRVWDPGTGAYTYHRQNGVGLVDNTVAVSKLANFTNAGAVLISNSGKAPVELPAASNGQVLTLASGVPAWADTFIPCAAGDRFEMTLAAGTPQSLNIGGVPEVVEFAGTRYDPAGIFDSVNYRLPSLTAGTVWYLYAQVYAQKTGATNPWNLQVDLTKDGVADLGTYWSGADSILDACVHVGGVMLISPGQSYVDVQITTNATGDTVEILANATNTRFGGFRIL